MRETVNVAFVDIVLPKVDIFERTTSKVAFADNDLYLVVILERETDDASVTESVTNFDFNVARAGVNVALTENDLNIEVICRASDTVNVADALITLFSVVMLRASAGVNVALTESDLYLVVIFVINGVNVAFAYSS